MLHRLFEKFKWHAFFLVSGLLYFRVASLQIDPHHDGIILAPAIAVSEGLTVQSQAFTQYGLLSPLLQGIWLYFTGPTLLNLRIFTAVQVCAIAIVLYKVLKHNADSSFAKLIALLWLTCSGIWATKFPGTLLPWPSLISTLLILTAYLFYLNTDRTLGLKSDAYLISAGALIGFSGFARIQSWVFLAPFVLALLLGKTNVIKNALKIILGFFIGLFTVITFLYSQGALDDYFRQSILFPLTVYPQLGSDNRYNRFQTALYVIELLVLIAFVWTVWKFAMRFGNKIAYIVSFAITISMLTWGFWIQRQDELWIRLRILFGEPFERILVSPFYTAAIGSFIALIYFTISTRLSIKRIRKVQFIPAAVAAIASLQLFPQSDVMHLWWITPLCLPFLLQTVNAGRVRLGEEFYKATKITFSTFAAIGILFAFNFIKGPWVEYELPVLKGTYASAEKVERVDFYGEILNFAKPRSASFDCADGLYSVVGGKYLAADEWFVNWGFSKETARVNGDYRFICDRPISYANSEAERLGMKLISYAEHKLPDHPWSLAVLKKG